MTDAATAAAMTTLLTSVSQALPTNGAQPLATLSPVALPTNPASPLQVLQNQALAVINPNAYGAMQPVVPWYKKPADLAAIGLGVAALLGIVYVARRKKRK